MQPAAAEIERDIGVRQSDRPGAPAETIAGFKQEDGKIRADGLQATGGGDAGGTGADDDDILFGALAFVTRHEFSFGRATVKWKGSSQASPASLLQLLQQPPECCPQIIHLLLAGQGGPAFIDAPARRHRYRPDPLAFFRQKHQLSHADRSDLVRRST